MAKTKRSGAPDRDPLAEPLDAFVRGDYPRAREGFTAVLSDPSVRASERETAEELRRATKVDPLTLGVGVACLALYAVASVLTALIQP